MVRVLDATRNSPLKLSLPLIELIDRLHIPVFHLFKHLGDGLKTAGHAYLRYGTMINSLYGVLTDRFLTPGLDLSRIQPVLCDPSNLYAGPYKSFNIRLCTMSHMVPCSVNRAHPQVSEYIISRFHFVTHMLDYRLCQWLKHKRECCT